MIIIALHVIITTMLHTCAGLTGKATTKVNKVSRVHLSVSTVGVPNTVLPIVIGDFGTTGNNHIVHPTL